MNTIIIKEKAKALVSHIDSLPRVYNQQFGYVSQLDVETVVNLNYQGVIDVFELYFKLNFDSTRNDMSFHIVKKKFRGNNSFKIGHIRQIRTNSRDLVKMCKIHMDKIEGVRAGCLKTPNKPLYPMRLIVEWCEVLEEEWSK